MKTLVTGGAGFIGSHLCDALLRAGHQVRVLDDLLAQAHPTGTAVFLAKEAELHVGDLRDRFAVDRALENVDLVFHLGGLVGNGQSMFQIHRYLDVNTLGTATLLEAMIARRAQFKRLVVASSMVVYGDGAYACPEHGPVSVARPTTRLRQGQWEPICDRCGLEVRAIATAEGHPLRPTSTYGISKRDQEELSLVLGRAHGLPTVALRYLNVYGSRQALGNPYTGVAAIIAARILSKRRPTLFEDGQQRRDFVHVSDVVRANLCAAEASDAALYQAFNVATGDSVTIFELAQRIARALGRPELEPHLTSEFREGDIRHCFADTSRAQALLNFKASTPRDAGFAELTAWAADQRPPESTDAANDELRARNLIQRVSR